MVRFDELAGLTEAQGRGVISPDPSGRLRSIFEGILKDVTQSRKVWKEAKSNKKHRDFHYLSGFTSASTDTLERAAASGLKIVKGLKLTLHTEASRFDELAGLTEDRAEKRAQSRGMAMGQLQVMERKIGQWAKILSGKKKVGGLDLSNPDSLKTFTETILGDLQADARRALKALK